MSQIKTGILDCMLDTVSFYIFLKEIITSINITI